MSTLKRRWWRWVCEFCFKAALKAREFGLFAKSYILADAAWNLVKSFERMSNTRVAWHESFAAWQAWKQKHCVDPELFHRKKKRKALGMAI